MPIIKSLSEASGSKPGEESRTKMGSFLTQAQFQTSIHSSNLFLTAAAQNLLCLDMAAAVSEDSLTETDTLHFLVLTQFYPN